MPLAAGPATTTLRVGQNTAAKAYHGSALVYDGGASPSIASPTSVSVNVSDVGLATVSWAAPTPPAGTTIADYSVIAETLSGGTWSTILTSLSSTTSTTLQIALETPYRFRVRAIASNGATSAFSGPASATWSPPQFLASSEIALAGVHVPPTDIKQVVSDGGTVLALREFTSGGGVVREVWAYHHSVGWHQPALQGAAPSGLTAQVGSFPNGVGVGKNRLFAYAATQTCPSSGACENYYNGVRTYEAPSATYPSGRLFNEGSLSPAATLRSDLVVSSFWGYSQTAGSGDIRFFTTDGYELSGATLLSGSHGGSGQSIAPTNSTLATVGSGLVWIANQTTVRKYVQTPNCTEAGCITYPQIGAITGGAATQLRLLDNYAMIAAGTGAHLWGSFNQGATWAALTLPYQTASFLNVSATMSGRQRHNSSIVFIELSFQRTAGATYERHLFGLQSIANTSALRVSYYGRTADGGLADDKAAIAQVPASSGGTQAAIFAISNPNSGASAALATGLKCWGMPYDSWRLVQATASLQVSVLHFSHSFGAINGTFYANALAAASDSSAVSYRWRRSAGGSVAVLGDGPTRTLSAAVSSPSTVDLRAYSGVTEDTRAVSVTYGASFSNVPADTVVNDGDSVTITAPTLTSASFGGPFGAAVSYQWEERLSLPYIYPEFWFTRSTASSLTISNASCNNAYRDFRLTLTVSRPGQTNAVWIFPTFQVRVRPVVTLTQQPGDRSVCTVCGTLFPANPLTSPPVYPSQALFFRIAYSTCPTQLARVQWQKRVPGGVWQDIATDDPLLAPPELTDGFPPDMLVLWAYYNSAQDTAMMNWRFRAKLTFRDNYVVHSDEAQFVKSPTLPS